MLLLLFAKFFRLTPVLARQKYKYCKIYYINKCKIILIFLFLQSTENTMIKYLRYIMIPAIFLQLLPFLVFAAENPEFQKKESKISVITIDPGHGGKDLGATVGKVYEKDIALNIALKLGAMIQSGFPGIKVVFTRYTDEFITLNDRAFIANNAGSDLFISIHVNAAEQKYVQGTETYVLGQNQNEENIRLAQKENSVILMENNHESTYEGLYPGSTESDIILELIQNEYLEQSILLASEIQEQFENYASRKNRSVRQAGLIVLRQINMPGVLIEAGFISNAEERKYLSSEEGATEIATSVFHAIKKYKEQIERKSIFLVQTNEEAAPGSKNSVHPAENESIGAKGQTKEVFYSVYLFSSKREIKTRPAKFRGIKQVFSVEVDNIYHYFSGRFSNIEVAQGEESKIRKKYPEAVATRFENQIPVMVKNQPIHRN